ncbi:hypothetical protein ACJIZ3_021251 [Penstemon smallii]|uniref:FBD domain-containing protein n=1 Tax=Penstemon smallii TaxID=265156 RepID=A0ABD3SL76_9LAMI
MLNYIKQVLESLLSVNELELGPWCIEVLSMLEMKGGQVQPSTRRCLILNAWGHTGILPGILGVVKSSPNLETLVIKGKCIPPQVSLARYRATTYLRKHKLDLILSHLKTIKITGFTISILSGEPMLTMIQILVKSAKVLKKMVITAEESVGTSSTSTTSTDLTIITKTVITFPRASPEAVIEVG